MKNKGRVRNVLVSDLDRFKELLIRSLICNNVSYVQIDNEFHFFDMIFRFYDFKLASKMIDEGVTFFGQEGEIIRVLSENELLFSKNREDVQKIFLVSEEVKPVDVLDYEVKKNRCIPSYSKKKTKRDNHMLNQRLKSNRR